MERKSNIFTHKFLPLFGLFCFIFFCFFMTDVSAFTFTHEGTEYTVPALPESCDTFDGEHYIIYNNNYMFTITNYEEDNTLFYIIDSGNECGLVMPTGGRFAKRLHLWTISNNSWVFQQTYRYSDTTYRFDMYDVNNVIYSTVDIYEGVRDSTNDGFPHAVLDNIIYHANTQIKVFPSILTDRGEIENNSFDYLYISPGDYSITETDSLDLLITNEYVYTLGDLEGFVDISKYQQYITLNSSSPYYKYNEDTGQSMFVIPKEDLKVLRNIDNDTYRFQIYAPDLSLAYDDSFTISIISSFDKETQNLIEEGNQTNKNIFQKIGDILNILNPFSDSFFGKTLVNLIVDGLKSLFIPEDGYFDNYFQELQDWFSDRLGFLYYPLDLLFSLFERFMNLGNGTLCINIPEIKEPFTNQVFIAEQSLDFNELLSNDTFSGIHNIYLLIVDSSVYIGLVVLLYHKYEEVVAS